MYLWEQMYLTIKNTSRNKLYILYINMFVYDLLCARRLWAWLIIGSYSFTITCDTEHASTTSALATDESLLGICSNACL